MPDMTIIVARVCGSVLSWNRVIGTHEVRYVKAPFGHPFDMYYVCDCLGYKYRSDCKHIKQAEQMRCNWGSQAFAGSPSEPNPDGTCPKCGGPTVAVKVGV